MRDLAASMQDKLASGLTTFCHCWLLQPTDGVKIGFTDHDEDMTFDGVTYERLAGMTASAVTQTLALNVDTMDIAGALQSDHLNESDLAAGLYDNASLTLFLVDWTDVNDRDIVFSGSVGRFRGGSMRSRPRCAASRMRSIRSVGASTSVPAMLTSAIAGARLISRRRPTRAAARSTASPQTTRSRRAGSM